MQDIVKRFWRSYDRVDQTRMDTAYSLWGLWTNMSDGERQMALKGSNTAFNECSQQAHMDHLAYTTLLSVVKGG